jgi:L-galactose dehydrogenase
VERGLSPLGRTALAVSPLSLGGAQFGQQYGPVGLEQARQVVHAAVDAGVNLIDTSAFYGRGESERILGEVLAGGLRERVAICTKAGRLDRAEFDFTAAGMRACLDGSLKRLRTDRVDILLAHDIEFADDFDRVFTETAEVLHRLKAEGKARFVGMSCLPLDLLATAIERCELDVVISYCHFNLQNRRLVTDLLPVAETHGVGVLNASPLGMGLLTNHGPPPWHPAGDEIKAACRTAAAWCAGRGADIAELGMRFCFTEPRIPSTISGGATADELRGNLAAVAAPPDPELLAGAEALLAPVRDHMWTVGNWPPPGQVRS